LASTLLLVACSEQSTPDVVNRASKQLPANATPVAAAAALGATPLAVNSRGVPRLLQGKDVAAAPAATGVALAGSFDARLTTSGVDWSLHATSTSVDAKSLPRRT